MDNLKIEISRPNGSSTFLQITLGKTMKGIVVLKRLMVEWVVVKAATEDLLTEEGKIDMWGESRYKVFRKVTENANAAMLHFYSPGKTFYTEIYVLLNADKLTFSTDLKAYPELAIRSFLVTFFKFNCVITRSFDFYHVFLNLCMDSRRGFTVLMDYFCKRLFFTFSH